MLPFALWTKHYDQDLKKMQFFFWNSLSIYKTKISVLRHKQHYEIHSKFRPWDGCQMVNTKSLILYFGLKYGLKCNKFNINKSYSFIST
jgi:hypothetical protein